MEVINNGNQILEQIMQVGSNPYLSGTMMVGSMAICIVVGLAICVFGLKIMRVIAAIMGMVIGAGIGAGISAGMELNSMTMVIVVIIGAVLGAVLLGFLRRLAAFILVFIYGVSICAVLLRPQTTIMVIVCLVLPLILAIVELRFWSSRW